MRLSAPAAVGRTHRPHLAALLMVASFDVASFFLAGCGAEPAVSAPPPAEVRAEPSEALVVEPPDAPIHLWVAGDVMSSAQIRDAAADADTRERGIAAMLEPLAELWRGPRNFVVVNLETPVTQSRRRAHSAAPAGPRMSAVYLNAPPYLLEGLKLAGVDALALANNHALDQGPEGLLETVELARSAQLGVIGGGPHADAPLVLGEGERELTLWNFYDAPTERQPEGVGVRLLDDAAFAAVAATSSPHVVVLVHVLGELVEEPKDAWREWMHRLVDAGADIVLVHGTHVPMAVERVARGHRGAAGPVARRSDVLEGDVLEGDVLEGDVLEGDVLEGDVLEGDVSDDDAVVAWGLGNLLTDMGRMAAPRRQAESKLTSPLTREGLVARITVGERLEFALLPTFETDDRFVRWHGAMPEGESTFWVRPLSACPSALNLPSEWPEPWRSEYATWVSTRRDHLVAVSGLIQAPCPGIGWLVP